MYVFNSLSIGCPDFRRTKFEIFWQVDNWKLQASGHVGGPCRWSISRQKDLLNFDHRRSFSSFRHAFIFPHAVFRAVLQITEHLEEATLSVALSFLHVHEREDRGQ